MVKVAIAQAHLQVGDVPGNILETKKLIKEAVAQGAQTIAERNQSGEIRAPRVVRSV